MTSPHPPIVGGQLVDRSVFGPLRALAAASAAIFVAACAHTPTPVVEKLQSEFERLESDPQVSTYASVELYEAGNTIDRLAKADADGEDLDQLEYIATRQLEIAHVTGEAVAREAQLAEFGEIRDQLLLQEKEELAEIRRREAELARRQATNRLARAEELQAKVSDLEARQTERGVVLTMRDILFGFDRSEIEPGAKQSLDQVAEYLNDYPDRRIVIEGYTDSVGDDSYNERLSKSRAQSVAEFFRDQGVEASRIRVRGHGEASPIAPNETKAGRQKNRRVEILLEDAEQTRS